ncbi:MAG TPA: hypothetical protein VKA76_00310 [Gammaproteobacteria bacterium]|nr:hypothetical protein [Gammaproteobacteria bacterium]
MTAQRKSTVAGRAVDAAQRPANASLCGGFMPYFVYKIGHLNVLEQMDAAPGFKEAKAKATELRTQLAPDSGETIRIIFAATELEAEDLLSRPSEPRPMMLGDD